MGVFDYVTDLYATLSWQEAEAEEPQKGEGMDHRDGVRGREPRIRAMQDGGSVCSVSRLTSLW